MRLRISFSKTNAMRFTSHLDLHRTWERTVRRARLPLTYSQGFNPRPKINLAAALPLGFTSECELVDIWLDEDLPEAMIAEKLRAAAPPGIKINKVENIDLKEPKTPNLIITAVYEIRLLAPIPDLNLRAEEILSLETLVRERRGKTYDLRILLNDIQVLPQTTGEEQRIRIILSARPNATGRPDEILAVLEIPANSAEVHRTELVMHPRLPT